MTTVTSQAPPVPSRVIGLRVASRVSASLLGAYVFVWGFISLGTALGVVVGMPYGEAHTLLRLLAFLVFLAGFCWAFAARSVLRVWLTFGGGGALMTLGAWWIAEKLV
jgi:hypothetical protein